MGQDLGQLVGRDADLARHVGQGPMPERIADGLGRDRLVRTGPEPGRDLGAEASLLQLVEHTLQAAHLG